MDLSLTPGAIRYGQELRAWVTDNLPDEWRDVPLGTGDDDDYVGMRRGRTGWDVLASRLWCSAVYLAVCEAAVQCHGGGMGFTWEQRLHLWHRAAIASRGLYGQLGAARAGIAAYLWGLPPAPVGTAS